MPFQYAPHAEAMTRSVSRYDNVDSDSHKGDFTRFDSRPVIPDRHVLDSAVKGCISGLPINIRLQFLSGRRPDFSDL